MRAKRRESQYTFVARAALPAWALLAFACAREPTERGRDPDEPPQLWPIPQVGEFHGRGWLDARAAETDAGDASAVEHDARAWSPSSGGGPCRSDPIGKPFESFAHAGGEDYVGRVFALPVRDAPDQVAIGDVSGDGRADIVGAAAFYGGTSVFLQTEDGPLAEPIQLDSGFAVPVGVALADVDRDGRLDIIVARREGFAIFRSLGAGEFAPRQAIAAPELGYIVAHDVDGDGSAEIVGMSGASLIVFQAGSGGLTQRALVPFDLQGGRVHSWCLGDVDGDSAADLISVLQGAGAGLVVQPHAATETFAASGQPYALGDGKNVSCKVGDFDGDGLGDLVVAEDLNGSQNRAWLLAQTPDGTLGPPSVVSTYGWSGDVGAFDLNNDRRTDLVRVHSLRLSVILQGEGGLGTPVYYRYPDGSSEKDRALALGDVNCDGCPDIVAANVTGLVVFYGDGCAATQLPPAQEP